MIEFIASGMIFRIYRNGKIWMTFLPFCAFAWAEAQSGERSLLIVRDIFGNDVVNADDRDAHKHFAEIYDHYDRWRGLK